MSTRNHTVRILAVFHLLLLSFVFAACFNEKSDLSDLCLPISNSSVNHHLIAVARDGNQIRARGFSSAVEPGATIKLIAFEQQIETVADADGRFDITVPTEAIDASSVKLSFKGQDFDFEQAYRVRDLHTSLENIAAQSIGTGFVPNDLLLLEKDQKLLAYLVSSGDNALVFLNLDNKTSAKHLIFPKVGANPWSVAKHHQKPLLAVSLFKQNGIALVDSDMRALVDLLEFNDAEMKNPQGVAFIDDYLLVAFANIHRFATKDQAPDVGEGMIALFDTKGGKLKRLNTIQLPQKNPNSLILDEKGRPWVVSSGVFGYDQHGRWTILTEGGLTQLVIRNEALSIAHNITLGQFAATHATFLDGQALVSSQLHYDMLWIPQAARGFLEGKKIGLADHGSANFGLSAHLSLGGGLVAVGNLYKNELIVLDTKTQTIFPWPFLKPIPLAKEPTLTQPWLLHSLALRPGRPGIDYCGPNAAALFSTAKLVPLSFSKVLGP